jgi:hypothetical protein
MKEIICDNEKHVLLTKEEYDNLVPKRLNLL